MTTENVTEPIKGCGCTILEDRLRATNRVLIETPLITLFVNIAVASVAVALEMSAGWTIALLVMVDAYPLYRSLKIIRQTRGQYPKLRQGKWEHR